MALPSRSADIQWACRIALKTSIADTWHRRGRPDRAKLSEEEETHATIPGFRVQFGLLVDAIHLAIQPSKALNGHFDVDDGHFDLLDREFEPLGRVSELHGRLSRPLGRPGRILAHVDQFVIRRDHQMVRVLEQLFRLLVQMIRQFDQTIRPAVEIIRGLLQMIRGDHRMKPSAEVIIPESEEMRRLVVPIGRRVVSTI